MSLARLKFSLRGPNTFQFGGVARSEASDIAQIIQNDR